MINPEILEKAIEKATENGWRNVVYEVNDPGALLFDDIYMGLIFNQDFAKALWGEREIAMRKDNDSPQNNKDVQVWDALYAWQYHLQQMVIADDPIKYLGENL